MRIHIDFGRCIIELRRPENPRWNVDVFQADDGSYHTILYLASNRPLSGDSYEFADSRQQWELAHALGEAAFLFELADLNDLETAEEEASQ